MDDTIVPGATFEENIQRLKHALDRLLSAALCSYHRNYVKNFAQIARPFHKLCEKASKFIWKEECEIAFKRLKEALTSPPDRKIATGSSLSP
jgi:hypothetical protein